jgi:hypothetical protein
MDMFGRHENKILGLLETGTLRSKLVFMNELGNKYVKYFDNCLILNITKDDPYIVFGRFWEFEKGLYEKFNDELKIIPLFDGTGKLKKDLFGTIRIKIIEMDKGYKPNTVFYGICNDDHFNEIIVKYGLRDRKNKNIVIGEIIEINPLELIESESHNKNGKLLKLYGKK